MFYLLGLALVFAIDCGLTLCKNLNLESIVFSIELERIDTFVVLCYYSTEYFFTVNLLRKWIYFDNKYFALFFHQ